MDLSAAAAELGRKLQTGGAGFYGKLLTFTLCAFFLSDVIAIYAGKIIPEPPAPRPSFSRADFTRRAKSFEDYNVIFSRNLFNSRGIIPGEEAPEGPIDQGGTPVRTSLPLNLIGTLVLEDELRSIATIEDKSNNSMVYPLRVQDEIPQKAKILKIEPSRVVFINTATGRREFVELPVENMAVNPRISLGTPKNSGSSITEVAPNQYSLNRTEVDKTLADLNNVLTQARCVPNFENGAPAGYKCFQIVPGSIYDKLGMKNGDVIVGLNGSSVNDPSKAFEMLNELKNQNTKHLELQIKRDGRTSTYSYDIR